MKKNLTPFFIVCLLLLNLDLFASGLTVVLTPSQYPGGFNISCNGLNNGSFEIAISNGTAPYLIGITKNGVAFSTISSSNTMISVSNLLVGNYNVTVTDGSVVPQVVSNSVTLIEPKPLVVTADPNLLPPCGYMISSNGGSDGKIMANVNGGTPGYTYLWSNNFTTPSIGNLPAGTYSVTVTDGNSCTAYASATLTGPTPLVVTSITSPLKNGYHISCFKGDDGEISLTVSGGCTPYTYDWGFTNDEHPTGLRAGHYSVIVMDAQGAITAAFIDLYQPAPISADLVPFEYLNGYNVSCYHCFDGSINVSNVIGGVGGYTYIWDPYGQNTQNIANLDAESYRLTITDANGCRYSPDEIILTQPDRDDWTITGNLNTNPNHNYLGTQDAADLVIRTNSIEQVRVTQGGNVGIGTSTPSSLLSVGPNSQFQINNSGEISAATGITSSGTITFSTLGAGLVKASTGTLSIAVANADYQTPLTAGTDYQIPLVAGTDYQTPLTAGTDYQVPLAAGLDYQTPITPGNGLIFNGNTLNSSWTNTGSDIYSNNSGNVGIGISAPSEKFVVGGGNVLVKGLTNFSNNNDEAAVFIGSQNYFIKSIKGDGIRINPDSWPNFDHSLLISEHSGDVHTGGNLYIGGNDLRIGEKYPGTIHTGAFRALVFDNINDQIILNYGSPADFSGGVKINGKGLVIGGAVIPGDYKLAVYGKIITEDVMVKLPPWPDYVFASGYKLRTIDELKQYINENNRLPGMPSAEQMASREIGLGKIVATQTEKIEEVTLYLIQLKEEIENLKIENKKLKACISKK